MICFDCGGDDRHLRWCPTHLGRPVDFTEPKPRARRSDPETSHRAAAAVQNLSETKQYILNLLAEQPSTDFEIQDRWADAGLPIISPSGLRTRRAELVEEGLLVDSGQTRLGPTGRAFTVWTTTPTKDPS